MTTLTTPTAPVRWRPRPSVRAAVARRILKAVVRRVPVDVRLPDGSAFSADSRAGQPVLELVRPEALVRRIADNPKIGIGEGYMAGDWRAPEGTDLASVLRPFAERMTTAIPPALTRMRRVVDRPIPRRERNSLWGSRRNIEAHYDLSNDLFAAFLDETMSYSAAMFDESRPFAAQDLAEAQRRKIAAVLDLANVRAGSRVLEIGTGWGALAVEAARRGAHVTTVTLSREQAELAAERVREAGLAGSVDIRLQDYREVTGAYDAVVSVEMIEAVGEEYWPTYFAVLDRLLAPGGIAAVQAIVMAHDRYLTTRRSHGWIQKHIFPGGLIPSLRAISEVTDRHTSLKMDRVHAFGLHYGETLRRWRHTFDEAWPAVSELGFDETFRRKWEFYLAYCEAGFDAGYLDVAQLRFSRPAAGGVR
ncbi:SAM-dependent methyltransferase [Nocardioides alcanivorans]|uniref:SAM-dependent methyltransferase n=1 Tax=Nocardioides alcanivorans TaxID=2897352 RepID=UPI001F17D5C2|nr:cyclopropane-fatty-acyl-phospholipid synthase family protein [Nocardioides alcanivorans]